MRLYCMLLARSIVRHVASSWASSSSEEDDVPLRNACAHRHSMSVMTRRATQDLCLRLFEEWIIGFMMCGGRCVRRQLSVLRPIRYDPVAWYFVREVGDDSSRETTTMRIVGMRRGGGASNSSRLLGGLTASKHIHLICANVPACQRRVIGRNIFPLGLIVPVRNSNLGPSWATVDTFCF
jgi:hypothetical protein